MMKSSPMNPPKKDTRAKSGGFTLIETAIVILILGIIIAPIFRILTLQSQQEEQSQEKEINKRVVAAITRYLRVEGVYPCPADPALSPNDSNFGEADCSIAPVNGVLHGAVPVRVLNLPFQLSANTKNWKHIYAVTNDLTNTATFDGQGAIDIVDASGSPFTSDMHFTIVNPGVDGKGAFSIQGQQNSLTCGSTSIDSENCDNDDVFVDAPFSPQSDPADSDHYDDTIAYNLVGQENTMWSLRETQGPGAGLDIINRNTGRIGIGTDSPQEKVHVRDGNITLEGGNVSVKGGRLDAEEDIKADRNISAGEEVRSPSFFYGTP